MRRLALSIVFVLVISAVVGSLACSSAPVAPLIVVGDAGPIDATTDAPPLAAEAEVLSH
jgi:hypothetical protein